MNSCKKNGLVAYIDLLRYNVTMNEIIFNKTNSFSKLYEYLLNYPESKLFYTHHELPHPADILSNQVDNVFISAKELLQVSKKDIPIIQIKAFFQSVDTFHDVCYQLLKTFYSAVESLQKENDCYKWLSLNSIQTGKNFRSNTSTHRDLVAKTNNYLKHNDARIFDTNIEYDKDPEIEGFFIGKILANNSYGPNPDIHSNWNDKRTAFSYNYIIRRLIGHIFLYESKLLCVLENEFGKIKTGNKISRFTGDKELFNLGKNVNELYFPNEYSLPCAKFIINKNRNTVYFPYSYSGNAYFKGSYNIKCSLKTSERDGTCNGYIPYLGTTVG